MRQRKIKVASVILLAILAVVLLAGAAGLLTGCEDREAQGPERTVLKPTPTPQPDDSCGSAIIDAFRKARNQKKAQ